MNFKTVKYRTHSLLLILIAGIYLFTAIYPVINYRRTDENAFTDIKDFLYVDKPVAVFDSDSSRIDTLSNEYIVMQISGDTIRGTENLDKYRRAGKDTDIIALHLPESKIKRFQIKSRDLLPENFTYHKAALYIYNVQKGGVSDVAGIKKGDIILTLNDEKVYSSFGATNKIQKIQEGKAIDYGILRSGERISCRVIPATIKIEIVHILLFSVAGITVFFGLFIGLKRPKLKPARLTALALVMLGVITANSSGNAILINMKFGEAIGWGYRAIGMLFFPVILHSLSVFPKENRFFSRHRFIVPLYYGLVIAVSIAYQFFAAQHLPPGSNLYIQFGIIAYLAVSIHLLLFTTRKKDLTTVKPVYLAYLVYLACLTLLFVMALMVRSDASLFENILFRNNRLLLVPAVLIPISYIYVIGSNHLLDIDIRFRRNIIYVISNTIFNIILIGGFLYLSYLLITYDWQLPDIEITPTTVIVMESAELETKRITEKVVVSLLILMLYFILRKVYKSGKVTLDNMFSKVNVDFRTISTKLREISKTGESSPDNLAKTAVETVGRGLMIKRAGIWFFKDGNLYAKSYYGINESIELKEFAKLYAKQIQQQASKFNSTVPIEYLAPELRAAFSSCDFKFLIPLASKKKLLGILLIGDKIIESKYSGEDFAFFADLTGHMSVILENAMLTQDILREERLRHEIELARKIQSASMPDSSIDIEGLDTAAFSKPAYEVGGDFFDYYRVKEDSLSLIVGDVSGKGTSAALYMSNALGVVRTLGKFDLEPKKILENMNDILKTRIDRANFITAEAARFSIPERKISLARAGHTPVFKYSSKSGKVRELQPKGMAIGLTGTPMFSANLHQHEEDYESGDIFLFISDGVVEARNSENIEIGTSLIYSVLRRNKDKSAREILAALTEELHRECRGKYIDDVTAVVVKAK